MNNRDKFDVNKLRLVALKYYSKEDNGVEYTEALSYAFLVKVDDNTYINPFALEDEYPVFEAAPYSNISSASNWESYGRKLFLANGIDESGPCYVSYRNNLREVFDTDIVTVDMLRTYMLKSNFYFKDREDMLMDNIKKNPLGTIRMIREDKKSKEKMLAFFKERGVQLQKVR